MEFNPSIPPPVLDHSGLVIPQGPGVGNPGLVMGYGGATQYVEPHHNMYPEPPPNAEFIEIKNTVVDGGDRFSPCSVAFDAQEELLWMGNSGGHVTSYYGLDLVKYTSFQVHEGNPQTSFQMHDANQKNPEVRQILTMEKNVFALCSDSLRCSTKFGLPQFTHKSETTLDLQCMLQTGASTLLLGGHQPTVLELDVATKQQIRTVTVEDSGCAILRPSGHFICAGDTSGKVVLRDPSSLSAVHTLQAHSGTLSDFDIRGNNLVTCGFGNRMGQLSIDRFLMVYDLRMMRAMSPMQITIDPIYLRFVPTYSDRICVVSQSGQFQVMALGALTEGSMLLYQVHNEGAPLSSFEVSHSYQAMAFGDSGGFLHLFTTPDEHPVFNTYSQETVFPHVEPVTNSISMMDHLTPYSIIPMQYPTSGKLSSDWPDELCQYIYRKPPKIDAEILRTMKMVQQVGYAPNPGALKRNQKLYAKDIDQGKNWFSSRGGGDKSSTVPESPVGRGEDPFVKVPKRYQKVEIKYSKLGVEDFDFRFYNKTNFAGLETHIPNAYCNAMLQVLYFLEPLRCKLLSHICDKEFCLSCELGFLFHMLDTQKGKTCQGSNFLRAFRTIPEASALGLVLGDAEETMGKGNLVRLIQNWSRFIMQQVHSELVEAEKGLSKQMSIGGSESFMEEIQEKEVEEKNDNTHSTQSDSIMKTVFGMELENRFKCRCQEVQSRQMTSSIIDLQYPDVLAGSTKVQGPQPFLFSQIVERSVSQDQPTQAWCNKCEKYQPHLQTKVIKSLPDVLALNCHLENSRDFEFWKVQEELLRKREDVDASVILANAMTASRNNIKLCRYGNACKRTDCKFRHEKDMVETKKIDKDKLIDESMEVSWVPFGLIVKLTEDGKIVVENASDEQEPKDKVDANSVHYALYATVAHIKDPKSGGNLVSNVYVGETYHQRKERVTCTQWYLFNDFSITPLDKKEEAVNFNLDWKVPCSLFFARKDLISKHKQVQVLNPITSDVLLTNKSLVHTPRRKNVTFTPLDDDEIPGAGTIVGLDAEFVTLNQEEAELRSDGTRSMLKPSQLSVARISCVRGDGVLKGEPFIDDYISTQEQVVDYLTQFSGIQPGDLDVAISSKHLTTLKSTYIKLRHLVDVGCIFVGHGLKKDFRVINLNVPKNQVIDTVELFHLPRQRMISLKFLAWHFLDTNIQSSTHDSIEDARTALALYGKYQELQKDGMDVVKLKLKELYEKGYKLHWKIPEANAVPESDTDGNIAKDASFKEGEESSTILDIM